MSAIEPCLDEIQMDASTRTITFPDHLRLDLGGVAKGWAADQAMLRLKEIGSRADGCQRGYFHRSPAGGW